MSFIFGAAGMAAVMATAQAQADDLPVPPGIALRTTAAGTYYTTADGLALYTYLRDSEPGVSTCIEACAAAWPPLEPETDASAIGRWQPIGRPEAGKQWAYDGHPVYRYAKDSYAGGMFGNNVAGAWRVLFEPIVTPPGIAVRETTHGRILTTDGGMTLYRPKPDQDCIGACLENWLPFAAPFVARPFDAWTIVDRKDGIRQWAHDGHPLYAFALDALPGDADGVGRDGFTVAVLDPPMPVPSWVTVQNTDLGQVYADAKGMTIYYFNGDLAKSQVAVCNVECTDAAWRPVVADSEGAPVGDWSQVKTGGGTLQWAYKGNPVYTHTRDTEPGAVGGDDWAAGVAFTGRWEPVMRPLGAPDGL